MLLQIILSHFSQNLFNIEAYHKECQARKREKTWDDFLALRNRATLISPVQITAILSPFIAAYPKVKNFQVSYSKTYNRVRDTWKIKCDISCFEANKRLRKFEASYSEEMWYKK